MAAQTELHRHLDVSLRLSTLLELARERGLEGQSTSLDAFRAKVVQARPEKDLREVLARFTLFQKVLDRPEVLERVAYEAVEDCRAEGTRRVELRFAPSFVGELNSLTWDEIGGAFHRGLQRALLAYPEMRAGLILIGVRDFGEDAVSRCAEFYLQHRDWFVAFDLAGNEDRFPCRLFRQAFAQLRRAGAPYTVHAGEAAGPENMWEALDDLGATRLGHGITCVRDPQLMRTLAERKICLEMSPTSNWLTGAVEDLAQHPLPQVLRAGIPVCINTDDPTAFGTTLPREVELCRRQLGLSEAEIQLCFQHAERASFLTQ
jgi:adenosine deaminase